MPHPGNTLARYPDSTQAPRPSNTLALHRVNPAPRQIHPRSASGPQHPSTASGPSQEPRNKESVRIAIFLRLAIVASSPIANRGTKTQQKWHISSLKEPRRAPNRKKVAKIPSFLFFAMGPIAATGQITRKRAEHHDQQPTIRNKKGAPMRTPPKKPIRLKSTLPWHHTARNKHRVQPSTYRQSPLRPAPRGCTEAR